MKTPSYWNSNNIISGLLCPLGSIYNLLTQVRIKFKTPKKVSVPVICIGNLTAGGTGKTPVSLSLIDILKEHYKNPHFVTRGYGGTLKNIIVTPRKHTARQCGDEPLLLARKAPVVVNPDRHAGALKAIKNGADIIVMDDGFQNPGLQKDLSFLVFDGATGIGNGHCIPAGPLRESVTSGIKRAQAAIILGEDKFNLKESLKLPCFYGKIVPQKPKIKNPHIIAFAGIGHPEKFYNSLKECKFNLIKTFDFPDHHFYSEEELYQMIKEAEKCQADIFTTSKDFVKIPRDLQKYFHVLEIEIKWKDKEKIKNFILKSIA